MSINAQSANTVEKYLNQYSETECTGLSNFPMSYAHGLVVPVYRESRDVLARFANFCTTCQNTLLILIVNRPNSDKDYQWATHFFNTDRELLGKTLWQSNDQILQLREITPTDTGVSDKHSNSAVMLVDRCINGKPLPEKQGVGLARKIGADILCRLIEDKKVASTWIFNTDADAHLPEDYFCAADNASNSAALVYPFRHCFDTSTIARLPTLLYEFSLHYYVNGLRRADSPYAYHTLGSIIAVDYLHYAKVRGFPKRAAAEDFYLLNKLAKTGTITSLEAPIIRLTARESTRVPFGTGPAVINLAAQSDPMAMPLYHPDSFCYLQLFLKLLATLAYHQHSGHFEQHIHNAIENSDNTTVDSRVLLKLTEHFELVKALQHCFQHGKKPSTRLQHLHHWFDGFKTLKLIHYLRDRFLGCITFKQWLSDYRQQEDNSLTQILNRMNLP